MVRDANRAIERI